ncbi:hypothetical protein MMC29_006192 [Sticta canariensis]|nr:hypothetical protein [Sticta canariensis]
MKSALLCPLACLVGLGTAVGGVKNGDDVGCCAFLRGELGGAGDIVGTSGGLELVASGDLGLGVGDKSVDSGGLGLGNSGEVFSGGEFVGLGQGDEVVASNGLGFGQADGVVGLGQDDEVAASNGLFGLRYGNWWG